MRTDKAEDRFVLDQQKNLVYDSLNNTLWWFVKDLGHFIGSRDDPLGKFKTHMSVHFRKVKNLLDCKTLPKVNDLLTAALDPNNKIRPIPDFKSHQLMKIAGTTAFKDKLWNWKSKSAFDITADNAGFTPPIQRNLPKTVDNLEQFQEGDTLRTFLSETISDKDELRVLLSDLALAASGRSDLLEAIIFFVGPPRTGKSTLLKLVQQTFGEAVGTFDASTALAWASTGNPMKKDNWKADVQFKNIAVCDEPKGHGKLVEGPATFDGQAIKTLCPRQLDVAVTIQARPHPATSAASRLLTVPMPYSRGRRPNP